MSASSAPRIPLRGQLAATSVAEVLQQLEEQRTTGRVHFETEVGDAHVSFVAGRIVEAHMGELVGQEALFRLLGIIDGEFDASGEPVEAREPITPSVAQLISERSARALEWRRLSEQAPPLSSVLRLLPAGTRALVESNVEPDTRALFELIDGQRTITELIADSRLDAVKSLGALIAWLKRGWVIENSVAMSLFPMGSDDAGVFEVVQPKAPPMATLPASQAPSPGFSGVALRRNTVLGLGVQAPPDPRLEVRPTPPPASVTANPQAGGAEGRVATAEVRRIISVEGSSAPAGSTEAQQARLEPSDRGAPLAAPSADTTAAPANADAPGSGGMFSAAPAETQVQAQEAGAAPNAKYVGRYEVLCRIGRGGMGSVYLCRLTTEGGFRRLFALKLLRSHLLQDSESAQRFIEEARLAGYVHHPNVVSVLDAGLHGSQPYLVMDYVEGGSLKQLLSTRPGVRAPELILPIVLDALAGLHAAHTLVGDDGIPLEIVHCDVSPENLIVGIDGVCRLTDFGVAKHGPGTGEREQVTHGKPGHLAPEQILGNRVDRRADIFSLGVVLYNALTGTKLFEAPTLEETLELTCSRRIEPPSTVGLRPPPSLDFVCMKALEREPERRYDTAEEMMMELRRIALRENLLAPTSDIAGWVRESVGRELTQRRLALLDASRRAPRAPAPARVEGSPQDAPKPSAEAPSDFRPERDAPESRREGKERDNMTHTIVLQPASGAGRRWALISASVLAAAAVLATLLWPNTVSKMFRLNTDRISAPTTLDSGARKLNTGAAGMSGMPPAAGAELPQPSPGSPRP